MIKKGTVFLIGAGCGDYDLITLRGKKYLQKCDTVIYDALIDKRLLSFCGEKTEKICVGKRGGMASARQSDINKLIAEKSNQGKSIARLKGGDPFVFGRGGEEIAFLKQNNIPFMVVPGISSCIAVPELAGIPVTHRNLSRSFHVVTGNTAENQIPDNLEYLAKCGGTLIFLMGLKNISHITDTLIRNGKDKSCPACIIQNGATENQIVLKSNLGDIAEKSKSQNIQSPAIIVIGETVSLDFSKTAHSENISVSVTGTKKFIDRFQNLFEKHDVNINRIESIRIQEYENNPRFDDVLENIEKYSCICFTSANGTDIFFQRMKKNNIDVRRLGKIKFAVIGSSTYDTLKNYGIYADYMPQKYTSECLAEMLTENLGSDDRILIPRAEKGSKSINDILDKNNLIYDDIKIYDTVNVMPENFSIQDDYIIFGSTSGVRAFFENGGRISASSKIVCIGDITAGALKQYGVENCLIPAESTAKSVIEMIMEEENEKISTT